MIILPSPEEIHTFITSHAAPEDDTSKFEEYFVFLLLQAIHAASIDPIEYLPDSEGGDERGYTERELRFRWMNIAIAADQRVKELEARLALLE